MTDQHSEFMANIQKNIEAADKSTKEKAETILKAVSDSYRDRVIAALTNAWIHCYRVKKKVKN